ncbi:MAG: hypothetical protein R3F43_31660 [bacterium]
MVTLVRGDGAAAQADDAILRVGQVGRTAEGFGLGAAIEQLAVHEIASAEGDEERDRAGVLAAHGVAAAVEQGVHGSAEPGPGRPAWG